MDGQSCDLHSSARAKAKVILANLGTLYWCQHCADQFGKTYTGEYFIEYEAVTV